jgi:hypothetical protein
MAGLADSAQEDVARSFALLRQHRFSYIWFVTQRPASASDGQRCVWTHFVPPRKATAREDS